MSRKGFATLLVALALACSMSLGFLVEVRASGGTAIPMQKCAPIVGTDRASCEKKKKPCIDQWGARMKWTGPGCIVKDGPKKGQRYNDGGCQCDGYCGYNCRNACQRDSQCIWATKEGKCYSKNGTPGVPLAQCVPA